MYNAQHQERIILHAMQLSLMKPPFAFAALDYPLSRNV